MIVSLGGGGELAPTPGSKRIWRTRLVPRSVPGRSAADEQQNECRLDVGVSLRVRRTASASKRMHP